MFTLAWILLHELANKSCVEFEEYTFFYIKQRAANTEGRTESCDIIPRG